MSRNDACSPARRDHRAGGVRARRRLARVPGRAPRPAAHAARRVARQAPARGADAPLEATYLAWLDASAYGHEDAAAVGLERGRVKASAGAAYAPGSTGHVRLNIATRPSGSPRSSTGWRRHGPDRPRRTSSGPGKRLPRPYDVPGPEPSDRLDVPPARRGERLPAGRDLVGQVALVDPAALLVEPARPGRCPRPPRATPTRVRLPRPGARPPGRRTAATPVPRAAGPTKTCSTSSPATITKPSRSPASDSRHRGVGDAPGSAPRGRPRGCAGPSALPARARRAPSASPRARGPPPLPCRPRRPAEIVVMRPP